MELGFLNYGIHNDHRRTDSTGTGSSFSVRHEEAFSRTLLEEGMCLDPCRSGPGNDRLEAKTRIERKTQMLWNEEKVWVGGLVVIARRKGTDECAFAG